MDKKTMQTINDCKQSEIKEIISFFKKHGLRGLNCADVSDQTDFPVLMRNDDAVCCDTIVTEILIIETADMGTRVKIIGCGEYDNVELMAEYAPLEALVEITDWLYEYEKEIVELAKGEDAEPKKQKYAFRFFWRQWADVVVEAEDEEEARELATEKYNNGDYLSDDADFENTDCTNVTETYKELNLF